jgi:hypothetical protein
MKPTQNIKSEWQRLRIMHTQNVASQEWHWLIQAQNDMDSECYRFRMIKTLNDADLE